MPRDMQSLSRTVTSTTLAALSARRTLEAHRTQCLLKLHGHALSTRASGSKDWKRALTFEDIGIQPAVVKSLHVAFPNVRNPTETQSEFIPQILSGRDVLLKDDTGTGKSFGLMLALLSKTRARRANSAGRSNGASDKPAITALVLVPHRDLAYQLYHWIEAIMLKSSSPRSVLPKVTQVLIRGASVSIKNQIAQLHKAPPHILIGTPQAVQEVFNEDRKVLQLDTLSTIVVDEVDYLIDAVPRTPSKYVQEQAMKRIRRHPGPTRELLNYIYDPKRLSSNSRAQSAEVRGPQLIMTSATFSVGHRDEVLTSGWLQGEVVKVTGSSPSQDGARFDISARLPNLLHYGLVVTEDGKISNIEGAVEAQQPDASEDIRNGAGFPNEVFEVRDEDVDETFQPKLDDELIKKFTVTSSPFNSTLLEAVAAVFALDVPRLALLVLPAAASVKRVVFELQQLGVNAIGLDLLDGDQGRAHLLNGSPNAAVDNPTLLVSTTATTRGLDLPELSHVFMLGLPEGRKMETYLHIAGRAGRFGRGGKVVTVVEGRREVTRPDGKTVVADEPKRLGAVLKGIGCIPTKMEHFE